MAAAQVANEAGRPASDAALPPTTIDLETSLSVGEVIFSLEAFSAQALLLRAHPHGTLVLVR